MSFENVGIVRPATSNDSGWFGVRQLSQRRSVPAVARGADLVVLSDAAHHALVESPVSTTGLEGVFAFEGRGSAGEFSFAPGSRAGTVQVRIDAQLAGSAGQPPTTVRLQAEVSRTWVESVTEGAADQAQQASRVASALARLAAAPGQQTVSVTVNGEARASLAPEMAAAVARPLAAVAPVRPRAREVQPALDPVPTDSSGTRVAAPPVAQSFDTYGPRIRGPVRPVYPQVWLPAEYPPPQDSQALIAELRADGK